MPRENSLHFFFGLRKPLFNFWPNRINFIFLCFAKGYSLFDCRTLCSSAPFFPLSLGIPLSLLHSEWYTHAVNCWLPLWIYDITASLQGRSRAVSSLVQTHCHTDSGWSAGHNRIINEIYYFEGCARIETFKDAALQWRIERGKRKERECRQITFTLIF